MENGQLDMMRIIWQSGFVVKFVLALLLGASIFSWGIIFKKRSQIKEANFNNARFLRVFYSCNNLREVMENCTRIPFCPLKAMFQHGHEEIVKVKKCFEGREKEDLRRHFQNFGMGVIERAMKRGMSDSNIRLDQHLSALASIGSITPFIGLFGTVWGIINSFTGLAGGGATLDAVAPGIAEALVATAIGLFAAIPAVWFYNIYSNENSKINAEMETFGQEFLNIVERSLL